MSDSPFIFSRALPFCPGCSHHLVVRNTVKALERLNLPPLTVVLVTDIGCHGIIDPFFCTHTVHGLHGRAPALAAGIAAGLREEKVIVYMGDGGASIGLQHLIECARLNFPITVIVFNNMLYGMTGGQPSSLTPCGFRTPLRPEGATEANYDICRLLYSAGAPYVSRVNGAGDYSEALVEAFTQHGFSLVEVIETCPSYGLKYNPGQNTESIAQKAGLEFGVWRNPERKVMRLELTYNRASLFSELKMSGKVEREIQTQEPKVREKVASHRAGFGVSRPLGTFSFLIAGSAGEGVQQAGEALARTGVSAGLYATKKGTYPVTVGTGYSVAELILSNKPILYTGIDIPDVAVIVSQDGLTYAENVVSRMSEGVLVIDDSLTHQTSCANVLRQPFRKIAGPKNAVLLALMFYLRLTSVLPVEAFVEEVKSMGRNWNLLLEQMGRLSSNHNYK